LDAYPGYTFAASQMQQFEWLEQIYPSLFDEVKVAAKEGRFIPIGGTWVEMDCNIPSGEAFCRQFLYGQRYLMEKFGMKSSVFWLPGMSWLIRYLWLFFTTSSNCKIRWARVLFYTEIVLE
jgi:alpha-mannosidase